MVILLGLPSWTAKTCWLIRNRGWESYQEFEERGRVGCRRWKRWRQLRVLPQLNDVIYVIRVKDTPPSQLFLPDHWQVLGRRGEQSMPRTRYSQAHENKWSLRKWFTCGAIKESKLGGGAGRREQSHGNWDWWSSSSSSHHPSSAFLKA